MEILVRLHWDSMQLLQTEEIGNGERWLKGSFESFVDSDPCVNGSDGNRFGYQEEIQNFIDILRSLGPGKLLNA